ncbi:DNA replication and repair protein RecF [Cloacibacillus sp. An23]|uniref:DNA replication/repair protein RecF n=1 Tax=Cloacibacillus sp. An23 TaxID=1965591 RepID=UPI000B374961|nr:DNA replication and repair protein RecF [Cloacibacillus sp. An23]OUO93215.1 hypothetical protein B5F39_07905 [Cloacibacillus sp. An23]
MGFRRVRFNNFRNIEPREMRWSPGLNLLTGENGSGKTNILEGLNIIAGWGPLDRGTKAVSIPTWNSGSTEVQLTGEIDGSEIIKVKIARRYAIRVDDKAASAADLRWKIPVLTFLPDDMSIVEGSSVYRRRMLDMVLALIIPSYAMRLSEYRRGVRQKAVFLKRGMPSMIADRALLPLASWIWRMREEGVALMSDSLRGFERLAPFGVGLSLKRGGAGFERSCEDDYAKAVMVNGERERAMRFPVVGPHRDDIIITSRERPASSSLSRGLRRRTAMALMLAASESVRRKLGREPVLLLDEVAAELDPAGKDQLFSTLHERGGQIFAATAEPVSPSVPCSVYRIVSGKIDKIEETV